MAQRKKPRVRRPSRRSRKPTSQNYTWLFVRFVGRQLTRLTWRLRKQLLVLAIIITPFLEVWSPAYWLAEANYFEARDESFRGRLAVMEVILNRRDNRRFAPFKKMETIASVVDGGRERGKACDFSYRCDGLYDSP